VGPGSGVVVGPDVGVGGGANTPGAPGWGTVGEWEKVWQYSTPRHVGGKDDIGARVWVWMRVRVWVWVYFVGAGGWVGMSVSTSTSQGSGWVHAGVGVGGNDQGVAMGVAASGPRLIGFIWSEYTFTMNRDTKRGVSTPPWQHPR
jgi:hypothetical protein